MSPIGDMLRVRCRQFPSLVDCCTLDWFSSWPKEALLSVAEYMLSDFNLPSEEVRKGLVKMAQFVHSSSMDMSAIVQQ